MSIVKQEDDLKPSQAALKPGLSGLGLSLAWLGLLRTLDQDDPGKDLLKHQNLPLLKGHDLAGHGDILLRKQHRNNADQDDLGKHLNLSLPTIFYHIFYHMVMSKQQHNK